MRAHPRKTPAFGRLLRELRLATQGKRNSLRPVVERLAESLGGHELSESTLWHYEKGRQPEAVVIWALAKLYGRDVRQLLGLLVEEWRGIPLTEDERLPRDAVILTTDEAACLERFRALSDRDRGLLLDLLGGFGGAPSERGTFRPDTWNGANRRSRERRQAS